MAKKGMKRPEDNQQRSKSNSDADGFALMVYPIEPHTKEAPVSSAYKAIDNDLARDNLENDIPAADLQDI